MAELEGAKRDWKMYNAFILLQRSVEKTLETAYTSINEIETADRDTGALVGASSGNNL